ncbi:YciI family protein [Phytohabitans sp. LJ34]|uniref:YciI family protein n=1 Tax=Phytohabitans sp. LJ34 TaxID=3452217 RepID=UPI003F8CACB8
MWIVELSLAPTKERLAARPAHRRLLASLHERGTVPMAGPLADDSGAVIVFDLPDEEAVRDKLAADPYLTTPGVAVVSVREWHPFVPA